jgi:hypothetical protein
MSDKYYIVVTKLKKVNGRIFKFYKSTLQWCSTPFDAINFATKEDAELEAKKHKGSKVEILYI